MVLYIVFKMLINNCFISRQPSACPFLSLVPSTESISLRSTASAHITNITHYSLRMTYDRDPQETAFRESSGTAVLRPFKSLILVFQPIPGTVSRKLILTSLTLLGYRKLHQNIHPVFDDEVFSTCHNGSSEQVYLYLYISFILIDTL